MYKAIEHFTDLQDHDYEYQVGDTFPHKGIGEVSEQRIAELSESDNKRGKPVIREAADAPMKKNTAEK